MVKMENNKTEEERVAVRRLMGGSENGNETNGRVRTWKERKRNGHELDEE